MAITRTDQHSNRKPRAKFYPWFPFPTRILSHVIVKMKMKRRMEKSIYCYPEDTSDEPEELQDQRFLSSLLNLSNFDLDLDPSTCGKSGFVEIMKGGRLDVVSFLSFYGNTNYLVRSDGETVGVDVVRNKYLLICCVKLPADFSSYRSYVCRSLIDAYTELPRDLFEIVLVAYTEYSDNPLWKVVFDSFFSAFQCLAIPFSDIHTRNFICSSIGLRSGTGTILVGPKGDILQHQDAADHFYVYGSGWYPFTDSCVESLETQEDILRIRLDPLYPEREIVSPKAAAAIMKSLHEKPQPPSLYADFLLCDPALILKRVDPAGGPAMEVSELSKKYIGLYLCTDGDFMESLHVVHQKCLAMKQELEIVLVCLPILDDPIEYKRDLLEALKLLNITSWFVFPFEDNRKVCRRLWRVFGQLLDDKLVILPPCNSSQHGEIEAIGIIDQFGMDAYPFTASKVIEQRDKALRSLDPFSWFIDGEGKKRTCLVRHDKDSNVRTSKLVGKRLLLYLDWLELYDKGYFCLLLMKHYREIKASDCEVVFVPLNRNIPVHEPHAIIDQMPWPIMYVEDAVKASVVAQLILRGDDDNDGITSRLIAFGKDGKILSKRAHVKLTEEGVTESLFADTLHEELVEDLALLNPPVYNRF